MLTVYAAWTEGALESDSAVIREAMHRTDRPALPAIASAARDSEVKPIHETLPAQPPRARPPAATARASEQLTGELTPHPAPLGSRLASTRVRRERRLLKSKENTWWKGRDSNPRPRHYECRALTS